MKTWIKCFQHLTKRLDNSVKDKNHNSFLKENIREGTHKSIGTSILCSNIYHFPPLRAYFLHYYKQKHEPTNSFSLSKFSDKNWLKVSSLSPSKGNLNSLEIKEDVFSDVSSAIFLFILSNANFKRSEKN